MLRQLVIRDVVLIDRLELEFEPGLGVLTGETGAGKSILLDALGLALGMRADTGLVRSGQAQASVAAEIRASRRPSGLRAARRAGHRARAGRAAAPAAHAEGRRRQPRLRRRRRRCRRRCCATSPALAVEIHGQHDDRGLLNPKGHRALLDAFGRLDTGAGRGGLGRGRRGSSASWPRRAPRPTSAERDRDWLDHAVGRNRRARARAGRGNARWPRSGRRCRPGPRPARRWPGSTNCSAARTARWPSCAWRRGGSSAARPTIRLLGRSAGRARPGGDRGERGRGPDRPRRRGAGVRPGAARSGRGAAVRHPRAGPQASRRGRRAGRAGRGDARPSWRRSRRAASGSPRWKPQLAEARAALSTRRRRRLREAAPRGRGAARCERSPPSWRRSSSMRRASAPPSAAPSPGPSGIDRVEFEVSTNPGAPFGPLTRIASGGELSRFILALKVALAEAGDARDDDLRRDRPRRRRRGGQRDRRAAGAAGARGAGAGRHPSARRSRRAPRIITGSKRAMTDGVTRTSVRKLTPTSGARKSRACCRARRSPTKPAPRRRG